MSVSLIEALEAARHWIVEEAAAPDKTEPVEILRVIDAAIAADHGLQTVRHQDPSRIEHEAWLGSNGRPLVWIRDIEAGELLKMELDRKGFVHSVRDAEGAIVAAPAPDAPMPCAIAIAEGGEGECRVCALGGSCADSVELEEARRFGAGAHAEEVHEDPRAGADGPARCAHCGAQISDVEHDDNGGFCARCAGGPS